MTFAAASLIGSSQAVKAKQTEWWVTDEAGSEAGQIPIKTAENATEEDSWWLKDGLVAGSDGDHQADDAANIAADIGNALNYDSSDPLAEIKLKNQQNEVMTFDPMVLEPPSTPKSIDQASPEIQSFFLKSTPPTVKEVPKVDISADEAKEAHAIADAVSKQQAEKHAEHIAAHEAELKRIEEEERAAAELAAKQAAEAEAALV